MRLPTKDGPWFEVGGERPNIPSAVPKPCWFVMPMKLKPDAQFLPGVIHTVSDIDYPLRVAKLSLRVKSGPIIFPFGDEAKL